MVLQIAERGRVALFPREEMFVDAQHNRAVGALSLTVAQLQEVLKPTLHGGAADSFPLTQAAAADAVPMFKRHAAPERFAGSFARPDAGEALPEGALAIFAAELARFQFQQHMPHSPAFVAQPANAATLPPQPRAPAVRALDRPAIAKSDRDPSFPLLDIGNLIPRQA